MKTDLHTPLWQLTVGEFLELAKQVQPVVVNNTANQKQLVYGIAGLAKLFQCSMVTAWKIKNSGKIDEAIHQHGRKIVVDAEKAISLLGK